MRKKVQWKKYFTQTELDRGLELYNRGNCLNAMKKDEIYRTAVVDGNKAYNVAIKVNDEGKFFASCSCKSSKKACSHIAALAIKIEKENVDFFFYEKKIEPYDPFSSFPDDGYLFSIKNIFKNRFLFSKEEWEEAGVLLASPSCDLKVSCSKNRRGDNEIESEIKLVSGEEVFMTLNTKEVTYIGCKGKDEMCSFVYQKIGVNRVCVHALALIRATIQYINANNPGDTTNDAASFLLGSIYSSYKVQKPTVFLTEKKGEGKNERKPRVLDIVPTLEYHRKRLVFSIKDENSKGIYLIKDIKGFLLKVKQGGTETWGKSFSVDFSFDQRTKRFDSVLYFIEMVMTYRQSIYPNLGFISIDNSNADLVFNLAKETVVQKEDGTKLPAIEKSLRLRYKFNVKRGNDGENEIKVFVTVPNYLMVQDGLYSFFERELIKYDTSSLGALESMVTKRSSREGIELVFGKDNIPSFYNSVLPLLMENGEVDLSLFKEKDKWAFFNPSFAFYLDYEEGRVRCHSMVSYGEMTFPLGSLIKYEEGRNESMEKWASSQLDEFFPYFNREQYYWSTLLDDNDGIYQFLKEGVEILQKMGDVHVSDSYERVCIKQTPSFKASVSLNSGLTDLEIESGDISYIELLKILDSYKKRKKYHRLKDGSFISLDERLDGVESLVSGLGLKDKDYKDNKISLPSYRSLYLDSLLGGKGLSVEKDVKFRGLIKDFKGFVDSTHEPPQSLQSILRPYQKEGVRWLLTLSDYHFGGILADEMGLGKTLEVITTLLSFKEEGKKGVNLVVSPSSLVYNWESEVKKFAPSLSSLVVSGSPKNREKMISNYQNYDILITSYDLLKRDLVHYRNCSFLSFIIDEAQYIKNSNTETAKSVKEIKAEYRFALSGTPIENRLGELWSVFDFLMPGFLYSKEEFKTSFELPISKDSSSLEMAKLKKMVSPFILRRRKMDVLKDLPEKIEESIIVSMEGEQRKLYDAEVVKMKNLVSLSGEEELNKSKIVILSSLMRIREICCDPSLIYESYSGESAKLDALCDLLDRAIDEGHRVLIFSQFVSMLKIIEKAICDKYRYFMITGETGKEERLELVNSFNQGDVPLFLISLKAGGTGLNLTGADIVIHYDPWWNVARENQATDRAHRIGQKKVVTVYKLIAKNSVEEKISQMQKMKKALSDSIIEGENVSLSSLTKEDLLEILS